MPSLKELANEAGVSTSTASIVFSGRSEERNISEATQKKVLEAARRIGYQPNVSARRLRSKSEMPLFIGVFWASDFRAFLMTRFLFGLQAGVQSLNRRCEIVIHMYNNDALMNSRETFSLYNAVIICNPSAKDVAFLESHTFPVPVVLYNMTSAKFSSVSADNNLMGEMAAEIFAARGHKQACVLATQGSMAYMDERVRGFQLKAESLGMTVQKIFQENSITGGYRGGHLLCAMKQQPDCVFCLSDAIAAGALRAFKEARFEIPEQAELISIGNGDKESEEYAFVSLSVIHLPLDQMASACLNTALELLDGRLNTPRAIMTPIVYHERESCGGVNNVHVAL